MIRAALWILGLGSAAFSFAVGAWALWLAWKQRQFRREYERACDEMRHDRESA